MNTVYTVNNNLRQPPVQVNQVDIELGSIDRNIQRNSGDVQGSNVANESMDALSERQNG